MAKIGIENIKEIKLKVLQDERAFDSRTIHDLVTKRYKEGGYDKAPKSREEADALGQKNFNGLMSSFVSIEVEPDIDGNIVKAVIAPTRYLIGRAMRDVMEEGKRKNIFYTPSEIRSMSPDMANVSLVAPLKIDSEYFLLSQIKGKALAPGQIHTGLVAGNINSKYLSYSNPLIATLQEECFEELGMDLSYLDPTPFIFMIDERETGQVNFVAVAKNVELEEVLNSYEAVTKKKLARSEELEVMALANLPIAGLALTLLEDGTRGLKNIICYKPTINGLIEVRENRGVRPYTVAVVDYISEKRNVEFLLEKAGI